MERKNNYAIQAQNAKKIFLSYDQNALAEKLGLRARRPCVWYLHVH